MTTLDDLMILMKRNSDQLATIQKEIKDSKDEIKGYVDEKLNDFRGKFDSIEATVKNQERTINNLQRKILEREIAEKKRNLIFYKVEEQEKSSEELTTGIINLLSMKINSNISSRDIDFIYRIGRKGNTPRPILIGFTSLTLKEHVLKNKGKLVSECLGISEDFPQSIRDKRKEAAPLLKSLYEKGYKVFMKQDKIIVNGENWTMEKLLEVNNSFKKRPASSLTPPEKSQFKKAAQSKTNGELFSTPKANNSPGISIKNYMLPRVLAHADPPKNLDPQDPK